MGRGTSNTPAAHCGGFNNSSAPSTMPPLAAYYANGPLACQAPSHAAMKILERVGRVEPLLSHRTAKFATPVRLEPLLTTGPPLSHQSSELGDDNHKRRRSRNKKNSGAPREAEEPAWPELEEMKPQPPAEPPPPRPARPAPRPPPGGWKDSPAPVPMSQELAVSVYNAPVCPALLGRRSPARQASKRSRPRHKSSSPSRGAPLAEATDAPSPLSDGEQVSRSLPQAAPSTDPILDVAVPTPPAKSQARNPRRSTGSDQRKPPEHLAPATKDAISDVLVRAVTPKAPAVVPRQQAWEDIPEHDAQVTVGLGDRLQAAHIKEMEIAVPFGEFDDNDGDVDDVASAIASAASTVIMGSSPRHGFLSPKSQKKADSSELDAVAMCTVGDIFDSGLDAYICDDAEIGDPVADDVEF